MITFGIASIEETKQINHLSENEYPFTSIYVVCRKEGNLIGFCVFRVHDAYAELIDAKILEEDKEDALFIVLVKSALNTIDLSGMKDVICRNRQLEKILIEKLGFTVNNQNDYYLNLKDYFLPCNCKKQ